MTRDEMQTAACDRVHDLIDGMLWAISELRRNGVGSDRASDLLMAIKDDADRASAINARIVADALDEAIAKGRRSSTAAIR